MGLFAFVGPNNPTPARSAGVVNYTVYINVNCDLRAPAPVSSLRLRRQSLAQWGLGCTALDF